MQRDENLLHINNKLMPFTWVTIRPGRSTPADLVYWTFLLPLTFLSNTQALHIDQVVVQEVPQGAVRLDWYEKLHQIGESYFKPHHFQ